jgi:uncharacterized protein YbcI
MTAPTITTIGDRLGRISTGLVHLHTKYYGKGPTAAKTYMINDTVICVLKEGFTTVERTLINEGRPEAVIEIRTTFQAAMQEEFTKVVEEATDRKVVAYMSQIHIDPDVAVELFLMEPTDEPLVGEHEHTVSMNQDGSHSSVDGGQSHDYGENNHPGGNSGG